MKNLPLFLFFSFLFFLSCNVVQDKDQDDGPVLFLPDDLEATLWAASPMLYNPTNMDIDARGRVWITEAVNYRNYNNDSTKLLHHLNGDRVMILEDTDHDGKADKSTVFVQDKDLVSPLGIAVIGNKIYVSCSPNLIVYTDNNGDDRPDEKEIFLTGFGGRDHDHALHSVTGGPDGDLYFNVGNAGPHTVTDKSGWTLRAGSMYTGGSPYNLRNQGNMKSDDGKVWVGGLALQINEQGKALRVLGHNFRNAYELAVDSKGDMWQNDNDDQVLTCRTTWLMEGGNAGYFSSDGTRSWQADQRPGQDIFSAHWHQDDPGVIPAGDNFGAGSPTGIVINEGDGLGVAYRGMLLSADAGRNVIFGYHPRKSLSGFDLGKRTNLITSLQHDNVNYVWNDSAVNQQRDKWFRPSDVAIGTDGAMYVADWYDPVVGGHQMMDPKGYGRIYKITQRGKKTVAPKIDLSVVEGQIEGFKSPAVNVRFAAFKKLKEFGEPGMAAVEKLIHAENPYHRARAIWLLAQSGKKGRDKVEELLKSDDENIRIVAFRALRKVDDDILPVAKRLTDDTSAFVRREVVIALGDVSYKNSKPLYLRLIKNFDGEDRWYLEALGHSLAGHEEDIFGELIRIFKVRSLPVSKWDKRFTALLWRLHPSTAVNELRKWATAEVVVKEKMKALTALSFINTTNAAKVMAELTADSNKEVANEAAYWLSFRQANDWFTLLDWDKMQMDKQYAAKKGTPTAMPDEGLSSKDSINYSVSEISRMSSDRSSGEKLFLTKCLSCHRVNNSGNDIGPNLTAIGDKFDREALLDAIIHPNAAIVFGYEPWIIKTIKGESFFGFLLADGTNAIVLKDVGGNKHTIAVKEISSRIKQDRSLMPGPSALKLTGKDVADIAGYLSSLQGK